MSIVFDLLEKKSDAITNSQKPNDISAFGVASNLQRPNQNEGNHKKKRKKQKFNDNIKTSFKPKPKITHRNLLCFLVLFLVVVLSSTYYCCICTQITLTTNDSSCFYVCVFRFAWVK